MADRAIYLEAIARWGAESQLRMVQEECGELTVAISHFQRGRVTREAVAEEIADVQIMAGQAEQIIGEDLVARAKAAKLERLRERLGGKPAPKHRCKWCGGVDRGCDAEHDGYLCTREPGHDGEHVACAADEKRPGHCEVLARWEDEDPALEGGR